MVKMGKKTSLHLVKVGKPAMDEGEEKKRKEYIKITSPDRQTLEYTHPDTKKIIYKNNSQGKSASRKEKDSEFYSIFFSLRSF